NHRASPLLCHNRCSFSFQPSPSILARDDQPTCPGGVACQAPRQNSSATPAMAVTDFCSPPARPYSIVPHHEPYFPDRIPFAPHWFFRKRLMTSQTIFTSASASDGNM